MQRQLLHVLLATIGCTWMQTAFAATDMEEGIKLYQAKSYDKARPYFEKVAKSSPNAWQPHYYLANVNLALGRMSIARYEYEACERLCRNPNILTQCQTGKSLTEKHMRAVGSSVSNSDSSESSSDSRKEKSSSALTPAQVQLANRKEDIMRQAKVDVAKVRQDTKEQLEREKANANQFYKFEDGRVATDIDENREQEINRECENKCRRIMEDADRKINLLGK